MKFSVLHISDLHRDLCDEVANEWLLDSLDNDFNQFNEQTPPILRPTLCIVTGDLVHGVASGTKNPDEELERQYAQAEEFLIGLADRFFDGHRERVVILPGNHDVCLNDVMSSVQRIEIPIETEKKARLVDELFAPKSSIRWSWRELICTATDSATSLQHTTGSIKASTHIHLNQNSSSMCLTSTTLAFA
jgi:3',5'-cyclic AMP phosphodiesterase CpdA